MLAAISLYVVTSDSHELCEQMHCEITKRQCLENYSNVKEKEEPSTSAPQQ